jgi:hypothetical protein
MLQILHHDSKSAAQTLFAEDSRPKEVRLVLLRSGPGFRSDSQQLVLEPFVATASIRRHFGCDLSSINNIDASSRLYRKLEVCTCVLKQMIGAATLYPCLVAAIVAIGGTAGNYF